MIGKLFNKGRFSEIEEIYSNLKKNYKDNFYIEIQRHGDQNEKSFELNNLKLSTNFFSSPSGIKSIFNSESHT